MGEIRHVHQSSVLFCLCKERLPVRTVLHGNIFFLSLLIHSCLFPRPVFGQSGMRDCGKYTKIHLITLRMILIDHLKMYSVLNTAPVQCTHCTAHSDHVSQLYSTIWSCISMATVCALGREQTWIQFTHTVQYQRCTIHSQIKDSLRSTFKLFCEVTKTILIGPALVQYVLNVNMVLKDDMLP